jgi:hypothetical protein
LSFGRVGFGWARGLVGAGWVFGGVVVAVVGVWCVGLLVPASASASFTRPPLREIKETTPGSGLTLAEGYGGGGVGVERELLADPGEDDDVWVGSGGVLDEFSPAFEVSPGETPNHFIRSVGEEAESLAIERASGAFYREGGSSDEQVAVDNSTDVVGDPSACGPTPGECFHYVTLPGVGGGVEKLNAKGEPVDFVGCGVACSSYVTANRITGRPKGLGCGEELGEVHHAVTVGAGGDIYVGALLCDEVFEYRPDGEYMQSVDLDDEDVPRIGSGDEEQAGSVEGLVYDASSKHLLVSLSASEAEGKRVGVVDEFEGVSGVFVAQITRGPGGGTLREPCEMAVDSAGDLYVVDRVGGVVGVWGPGGYYPTVVLRGASDRGPYGAVLNGTVDAAQRGNPEAAPITECVFEYVEESVFQERLAKHEEEGFAGAHRAGCAEPDVAELQAKSAVAEEAYPVRARIAGLEPGVSYRYRLVAGTEAARKGGTAQTGSLAFTAPAPPLVLSASAGNVSSSFAELGARINPLGAATSYHFEYLTAAAFAADGESWAGPDPAVSVPVPDGPVGAGGATGSSVESVLVRVGGLLAGTSYRFRVVASSECEAVEHPGRECVSDGEDEQLTTLPEVVLGAEGRGYELVTPAQREGGSDMFASPVVDGIYLNQNDVGTPAASGGAFFFETDSNFGGFPFALSSAYVFRREPEAGRWGYVTLAPRALGVQDFGGALLDTEDLSRVAFDDSVGSLVGEEGARLVNLVGAPGGPYTTLHEDAPVHVTYTEGADTHLVGGSQDLGHVVLESATLAGESEACPGADAVEHGDVLCEWSGGGLVLVDTSPESEALPASECGARLGLGLPTGGATYRALSADGTSVIFTAPDPVATTESDPGVEGVGGCWNRAGEEEGEEPVNAPQLYVRVEEEHAGTVTHRTLEVSEPEEGVQEKGHAPVRYPAVYSGASEDDSRVFFSTKTELTGEAAELGLHDLELYEWRSKGTSGPAGACPRGEGCLTRVSAGDAGTPGRENGAGVGLIPAVAAQGTAVYFLASGQLTAVPASPAALYRYDTETGATSYVAAGAGTEAALEGVCATKPGAGPCSANNIYTTPDGRFLLFPAPDGTLDRYDAETGATIVIAAHAGAGSAWFARSASGEPASGPVTAMSANGEYVFFDTPEKLVPQAENHTLDTYQWHDGRISLVGSGSDPAPTYFLGYSPYYLPDGSKIEGGNVFIGTHAKLSSQDTNGAGNIYDARICEPESPCIEPPPSPTSQCEGNSCQTPTTPPSEPVATLLPAAPTGNGSGVAVSPPPKKTAAQVRAEKLARALKVCRKERDHRKRVSCEASARRRYGPVKKAKKSASSRKKSGSSGKKPAASSRKGTHR